ncbi:MAG: DUF3747 domain-containing protein [Elainellaceae cyanobacterium]
MKSFGLRFCALTALLSLAGIGQSPAASAAVFSHQELSPDKVVTVASPIGTRAHQLLVLEQLSDRRQCWEESGDAVEPLLLQFDFTGICGRGTDSNGYSVRVGGEDLGWRYDLRVLRDGSDLKLVARSVSDRSKPDLEIGRATSQAGEFTSINLNPGWRVTKRTYNGQVLGHYYLTHDQDFDTLVATAAPTPTPAASPVTPSESPTALLPRPGSALPLPTLPIPGRPGSPSRPSTPLPRPLPRPSGPPAAPSEQAARLGFRYRVVVPASSASVQAKVRTVVPDAFRTLINGEVVMQAGLFRDRLTADATRQQLRNEGLRASILEIETSGVVSPTPSTPTPSTPTPRPSRPAPRPATNGRLVVAIDPGHGGRDPGAVGIGGLQEKEVVRDISDQVVRLLEQAGIATVMTRPGDQEVDLEPRVAIAERSNADIFVSIHANAISMSRPQVNGIETFFYSSAEGRRLATAVQDRLIRETGSVDRGVKEARFYVISNTSMPAILVETGFVTGTEDAARLRSSSGRRQISQAIANGIIDYLR